MSGHNKWSQIRRQKEANDLKKGQVYTKIAKQIVLAAKQGGADAQTNFALKMALSKAKSADMPTDSIDKAIKKGLGEDKNANLIESATYEAYGYAGATLLIDVLTDNKNRSAADIRMIVEKNGGRIVEAGGISWQYDLLGLVTLVSETEEEKKSRENKKWNDTTTSRKIPTDPGVIEKMEIQLIDVDGVTDLQKDMDEGIYVISIYTKPEKLDAVRKAIEGMGYDVEQAELIKKAQNEVPLSEEDGEKNRKLITLLEDNDDVDTVWTNIANL